MKKTVHLTIPEPCHENWKDMIPSDKGRFCASCQKNVVDFTKMTDREVISILNNDRNTCGRFLEGQLGRELYVVTEKKKFWSAAAAALLGFMAIGTGQAYAQQNITYVEGRQNNGQPSDFAPPQRIITGTVSSRKSGKIEPLQNVKVFCGEKEALTDKEGNFSIEASEGDELTFIHWRMKTKRIVIDDADEYKVKMRRDKTRRKVMMGSPRYF